MLAGKRHAFLVYGVDDQTHEIVGTSVNLKKEKKGGEVFENWLNRMMSPRLNIEFNSFEIDGKRVEIASVEPAYDRPVKFINVEYIRVGEVKKRLDEFPQKERALWALTDRHSFERGIAATHVRPSEFGELFHCDQLAEIYYPGTSNLDRLIRCLLDDEMIYDDLQGGYDITNLLAILGAKDLHKFKTVSNKAGRVIVYEGRDKTQGLSDETGQTGYAIAFPRMLAHVMKQVTGKEFFSHGVRKREQFYPEIAIREFLANALIHQDLNASGSRPTVEIYADKIKIFNLGRPFVEPERIIDAPPRSRNERLAWFMSRAKHCEERGSGIIRALLAIEAAAQAPPLFQSVDETYIVTLFKATDFGVMSKEDRIRACYQHAVIRHLRQEPMTNSTLRVRLGLNQNKSSSVTNVINETVAEGLIKPLDEDQGRKFAKYVPHWA